jgi:hypothetical protein
MEEDSSLLIDDLCQWVSSSHCFKALWCNHLQDQAILKTAWPVTQPHIQEDLNVNNTFIRTQISHKFHFHPHTHTHLHKN